MTTPENSITVKAPAKINLFLEIGERMPDGYHNIESVMQSVTLYDMLTVNAIPSGIKFDCSIKNLVYDKNLVILAAQLFFAESGIDGGAELYLKKRIPVSAGLGGGSTDAAAALTAMNELYGRPFSDAELSQLGKRLGADVPFCLKRGLCRAAGIGEMLEDIGRLPRCCFVVAKGGTSVSTRAAFEMIDGIKGREVKSAARMLEAIKNQDLRAAAASLYNGFEINLAYDENIKKTMRRHKALNCLMSGSGPSVFGVFERDEDAQSASDELRAAGYTSYVCRPERKRSAYFAENK
ncbi:MAG: 4-(cytidine 5'-diphospho)-2-C-methyl-D-erythritol kinase [Clostridia bacterium]|nr:4-(cytidine 5'-diphospho)-2-C-methyl-D-erythritol kinase [Clostridia bacterium]